MLRRLNVAMAPGKVVRAARGFPFWGKHVVYTTHALQAAREDRYGNLLPQLPDSIGIEDADRTVEVEMDAHGAATKVVLRLPTALRCGNDTVDLVMVVARCGSQALVKTVWGNLRSDNHKLLKHHRLSCQ